MVMVNGSWNDIGGSFCTTESGIMTPETRALKWLLTILDEAFDDENEWVQFKRYEYWLPLPGGFAVNLVDKWGTKTDFKNVITPVEIWGFRLPMINRTFVFPKRDFASTAIASLCAMGVDYYFQVDSSLFKKYDMDGNEIGKYFGIVSDTTLIAMYLGIAYGVYKFLKYTGLAKLAKNFLLRIYRWYKMRRLRKTVDAIYDATVDQIIPSIDELEDWIHSKVTEIGNSIGLRMTL